MSFHELIDSLIGDTLASLSLFTPELVLCGAIVLMLLLRIFGWERGPLRAWSVALVGSGAALGLALWHGNLLAAGELGPQEIFTGLLVFDSFTVFFRCLLLGFAVLFCLLTRVTGIPDREDGPDFYSLVFGATLGMMLMASANHLLMVFLAVEMASVPSFVLAGIMKGRRRASEAALKYAIYGAGTAGVMLYGISLLAGVTGSAHLPTIAQQLAAMDLPQMIAQGTGAETIRVLALGGLMLMVGLAFKLSAVPFHFWCPDVFEGATAEVNAFLSVASKAAALALLVRVAFGFGYAADPVAPAQLAVGSQEVVAAGLFSVADQSAPSDEAHPAQAHPAEATGGPLAALQPIRSYIVYLLAWIAMVTATFGNLAAYGQRNIKRLLAYSTIAHAGYMIMPVAAAMAVVDTSSQLAQEAIAALAFYIAVYLFMNLGAFAVVAFLRNAARSEEIEDYAGLIRTCPVAVVCFALLFVSLIGLPPLAGFIGKLAIFLVLVKVGGPLMYTMLVVAGLNTVISLIYYLRVVKVMTIDPEPDTRAPVHLGFFPVTYTVLVSVPVLVLGVWPNEVYQWSLRAAAQLF